MLSMLRSLLSGPRASATVQEAAALMASGATLVDVRDTLEWRQGHVPGATHIPLADVQARGGTAFASHGLVLSPGATVLLICHSGMRSGLACQSLGDDDRLRIVNVTGGMVAWQRAGLPVTTGG